LLVKPPRDGMGSPRFELRQLTLDTKAEIEAVTLRLPPYCDFNFASLFVWDIDDDTRFARVGDHLILELGDNVDRSLLYTLTGSVESPGLADLADDLIHQSIEDGYGDTLRIVPEEVARVLEADGRFVIEPDPDNHDYVMSTARLATELKGSRRAESIRFQQAFPSATLEVLPLASETARARLAQLFETWARTSKPADPLAVEEDRVAFGRALRYAAALNFEALGVVTGDSGDLVACEIVEILPRPSTYAVSHFQKTDRRAPGVASFLNQAVARWLGERGVERINFEQDLGVPGLRDAKRSYQPVDYLRKYDVRRA
jgi:uncharacterized protein